MTVCIMPNVQNIPTYTPAPPLPDMIKLDINEIPHGPLPHVRDAIHTALPTINHYPDSSATSLVQGLARHLQVDPIQVAVGAGSCTLFQQIIQATCDSTHEVILGHLSFEAYPIMVQVLGARHRAVPLTEAHGLDLDAMYDAIGPNTRMVVVTNPNNPTGTMLDRDSVLNFIDKVPPHVLVVLDEAYREFADNADFPDGVELVTELWAEGKGENVVVLRTFSKAYGLAGMRVGYCVAAPPMISAIRKTFVPFGVTALAQVAALASLTAKNDLAHRVNDISTERARMRGMLTEFGFTVPDSGGNFLWLPLGARSVLFREYCLAEKVMVRVCGEDGARVTVGSPQENDVFLAAAYQFANTHR